MANEKEIKEMHKQLTKILEETKPVYSDVMDLLIKNKCTDYCRVTLLCTMIIKSCGRDVNTILQDIETLSEILKQ
jgi:hypothetical protein